MHIFIPKVIEYVQFQFQEIMPQRNGLDRFTPNFCPTFKSLSRFSSSTDFFFFISFFSFSFFTLFFSLLIIFKFFFSFLSFLKKQLLFLSLSLSLSLSLFHSFLLPISLFPPLQCNILTFFSYFSVSFFFITRLSFHHLHFVSLLPVSSPIHTDDQLTIPRLIST